MKENETDKQANKSLEEGGLELLKHCSSMEEAIYIVDFYKKEKELEERWASLRKSFNENKR